MWVSGSRGCLGAECPAKAMMQGEPGYLDLCSFRSLRIRRLPRRGHLIYCNRAGQPLVGAVRASAAATSNTMRRASTFFPMPFCHGSCDEQELADVMRLAIHIRFSGGQTIFSEGEPAE